MRMHSRLCTTTVLEHICACTHAQHMSQWHAHVPMACTCTLKAAFALRCLLDSQCLDGGGLGLDGGGLFTHDEAQHLETGLMSTHAIYP